MARKRSDMRVFDDAFAMGDSYPCFASQVVPDCGLALHLA